MLAGCLSSFLSRLSFLVVLRNKMKKEKKKEEAKTNTIIG